jgi:hypothetical protein
MGFHAPTNWLDLQDRHVYAALPVCTSHEGNVTSTDDSQPASSIYCDIFCKVLWVHSSADKFHAVTILLGFKVVIMNFIKALRFGCLNVVNQKAQIIAGYANTFFSSEFQHMETSILQKKLGEK